MLDRTNRVAYAALSERCTEHVARQWAELLQYSCVTFRTRDATGAPVYHTNVLLSIGTSFAVVCPNVIHPDDVTRVLSALRESGRIVIEITTQQMSEFCANILELRAAVPATKPILQVGEADSGASSGAGSPSTPSARVLAMSQRAYEAFTSEQRSVLYTCVEKIVAVRADTIERIGGGGVRCMLAELF